MRVREKIRGDVHVLVLSGQLDRGRTHDTLHILERVAILVAQGHTKVAIDMSAIRYLSARGHGEWISAWKLLQDAGGRMALVAAPNSELLYPISGLDFSRLKAFKTLDSALEFLARDTDGPPTDTTG
jgi:anti-anti-sigma regulatory factor